MYLRYAGNPPGKDSTQIIELSETLDHLARYLRLTRAHRFRNANGVYTKLMNFRRFDPVFTDAGKVGLTRGEKTEEEVWADFARDPARCHQIAETIKQALATAPDEEPIVVDLSDDDMAEAEEGRVVTTLHRGYERKVGIVKAKKARALALFGRLACEACGFDFGQHYGERGEGFIECHHTRPLHTLRSGEKTKAKDLRLLCANCHRMVHATRQWLSFEELVAILSDPGARHAR